MIPYQKSYDIYVYTLCMGSPNKRSNCSDHSEGTFGFMWYRPLVAPCSFIQIEDQILSQSWFRSFVSYMDDQESNNTLSPCG